MNFDFQVCPKIVFGENKFQKLCDYIEHLGKNFMFLSNIPDFFKSDVYKKLDVKKSLMVINAPVFSGEPTVELVDSMADLAKRNGCDCIIGIGGGSAIDTAKAAAGVASNGGSVRDYLERIGDKKLNAKPLNFVAVPTTSGTGAEVTKNAVITSTKDSKKASMRDDMLMADLVIIDPMLNLSTPKTTTAYSGMDAICQLIESYTTKNPNMLTDALCLHHIPIALDAIKKAYDNPNDVNARGDMAVCACVSGMTLANSGLGLAHGMAAGLGAMYDIPHGKVCAILLPVALKFNHANGVMRISELSKKIYGKDADYLINKIIELNEYMGIPKNLSELNIKDEDTDVLIEACLGPSMKKNPYEVTEEHLREIIAEIK